MATQKFKALQGLDNNAKVLSNIGTDTTGHPSGTPSLGLSGNNALTLTTTGTTNVTLPTSGTLLTTAYSSTLDANARLAVSKNSGATVGTRRRINFIEGTNVTLTVADDAGNEEIDVTIAAAGSGTVTNTGGSLTSNAVVLGAGSNDTKVVAGITTNGTAQLSLGVASTTLGSVKMFGNTSGDVTVQPSAAAGTATVITLPATTGTAALGTGTANEIAYWTGTNTLGSLTTGTYPSLTELSYVKGVTSSLQTQLNAKASLTSPSFTTSVTTGSTSFDVFNTTATTVNAFGAATTLAIGNTATAAQTVNMFTASTGASTYNFASGATANATTKTLNIGTGGVSGSTTNINLGSSNGGTVTVNKDLVVSGNFTVNGTTTTINATELTVDDKNIELGSVTTPSDVTAEGGGITLRGASDKSFIWNATAGGTGGAWTSSDNFNLASGKQYRINGTQIAASNLSNGTTGSGSIVLDVSPTLTTPQVNTSLNLSTDAAEGAANTTVASPTAGTAFEVVCISGGGLPVATYRSAVYNISVKQGTSYQVSQVMAVHTGAGGTATCTEFGTVTTGSTLATFDVDVTSGNMRLMATPVTGTTQMEVKVQWTGIKV